MARFKPRYKYQTGGPVSYNGNPVIQQDTENPYEQPAATPQQASNNSMWNNAGTYTGMAAVGGAGLSNDVSNLQNSDVSQLDKAQGVLKTQQNVQAAVPVYGQINAAKQSVVNATVPKLDAWNPEVSFLAQNFADPAKAIGYASAGIFTPKQYKQALADDKMVKPEITPFVDNKDYQQDAAWQKLNNQTQRAFGGNLTQYEGFKHEQGGIPLGAMNEVEAGETRGPSNTPDLKDYIYSDKLRVPGKKHTFAKMSKMIENKHSKRDNDKLSDEQKERELRGLMDSQEQVRMSMMERAYKRAYGGTHQMPDGSMMADSEMYKCGGMMKYEEGGRLNFKSPSAYKAWLAYGHASGQFAKTPGHQKVSIEGNPKKVQHALGGDVTDGFDPKSMIHTLKPGEKPYTNDQLIAMGYQIGNSTGEYITPTGDYAFYKPQEANIDTNVASTNMNFKPRPKLSWPTRTDYSAGSVGPRYQNSLPEMKYGGRMQYFNGSYLQSQPAGFITPEERDRLAFENSRRNPLLSPEENQFYTDNTNFNNASADYTRGAFNQNNITGPIVRDTMREAAGYNPNYRVPGQDTPMEPMTRNSNIPTLGTPASTPDQLTPMSNPSIDSPRTPRTNNFDPNSLYNVGNYLGAAYDIYRGVKGGDPVNYKRVNAQTVNPDLVNYQPSRDLQRRDVKEGFRATQQELKNVNNPAQYLSLLTQTAGQRDKTISDSIAKSYENELNTNAGLRNQAKYYNAGSKSQADQFNASTQRAEADARQMEKDVASNTLQAGLAGFGEALAGTGRDKQAYISQAESKKFIGSVDFSPITNEKGKITGYKHKSSGKIYNIKD